LRTLLLIFAIWAIVMILRRQWSSNNRNRSSATQSSKKKSDSQKTVKCKQCGLHIPLNEALRLEKNFFCSEFHLKQAKKHKDD